MKKLANSVLLICLIAILWSTPALAHLNQNEHYRDIEKVLFGEEVLTRQQRISTMLLDDPANDALISLEHATAIALDQYKGLYQDLLDRLNEYGVPYLPPDAITTKDQDERGINFQSSPSLHRSFTHRGWTFAYQPVSSKANWPVRQDIMIQTAKRVFDPALLDDTRCDAFCAVLYYIHVLGDLLPDSKEKDEGITIQLIQRGASTRNPAENSDIFLEFERYLGILFRDQQGSESYRRMMDKLRDLRKEVVKVSGDFSSFPNKNDPEAMKVYHEYADRLYKEVLIKYVHHLLSLEPFFQKVFYT